MKLTVIIIPILLTYHNGSRKRLQTALFLWLVSRLANVHVACPLFSRNCECNVDFVAESFTPCHAWVPIPAENLLFISGAPVPIHLTQS